MTPRTLLALALNSTTALFAAGLVVTVVTTVIGRLRRGATWSDLRDGGFDEIVPLSWAARAAAHGWWIACGLLVWTFLEGERWRPDWSSARFWVRASIVMATALVLWRVARALSRWLSGRPPDELRGIEIVDPVVHDPIDPEDLRRLGERRFPSDAGGALDGAMIARWGALIGCIAAIAGLLVLAGEGFGWRPTDAAEDSVRWAERVGSRAGVGPGLVLLACGLTGVTLLVVRNSTYQVISGQGTCTLLLASALVTTASLAVLRAGPAAQVAALVCILAAAAGRAVVDLVRAAAERGRGRVRATLSEALAAELRATTRIAAARRFRLPPLDVTALSQRIARGATVAARENSLAARNFGRFLRCVEVEQQSHVAARLRMLFLRRRVDPQESDPDRVPIWDEQRFPLMAPAAYADAEQRLSLPTEYHYRVSCLSCSGSGTVSRWTSKGSQSERCGSCGGSGSKWVVPQLVTEWIAEIPSVIEPPISWDALVAHVNEEAIWTRRMVENREPANEVERSSSLGIDESVEILADSERALALCGRRSSEMAEVGARLYRAEFALTLFRSVHARFVGARAREAWMFGDLPVVHFPRLPFSWATYWTIVFLPVTLAAAAGATAAGVVTGARALAKCLIGS